MMKEMCERARRRRRDQQSGSSVARVVVSLGVLVPVAACSSSGAPAATSSPTTSAPTSATASAPTSSTDPARTEAAGTSTTTSWTQYHRYPDGSGSGPSALALSHVTAAWTSPQLDGTLYGEPLVWGDEVVVATENDTVYALSATDGTVLWSHHLAHAVPATDLPCGNIAPTVGITGTPVIDAARSEVFLVADELVSGRPHHVLYGLDAKTGTIELTKGVDPPGSDPAALLQRVSLTLDDGHVVFGFGGNSGDCSTYHGWVESVPEAGGTASRFEVDSASGDSQGAVWMGGAAPVVDSSGHIWIAAGNGSVTSSSGRYDDSDSVLELSSNLTLLQYFAPSTWRYDNAHDLDLGSEAPAVLPNGLVLQAGKSRTAFLLRASRLGGVGGQIGELQNFCGSDVDGGPASTGSTVYVPCMSGIVKVATDATNKTVEQRWQTATGAGGPPILAGGLVWTIAGGTLYALSPSTGNAIERLAIGQAATSFPSPSVGDGLVLAPASRTVHAFRPG